MANFEEMKKVAAEKAGSVADKSLIFARKVADKTKKLARVAVLRSEMATEREALRSHYMELGKAFYNANKDTPCAEYEQLFADIAVAEGRLAAKAAEIESLKADESEAEEVEECCCCECAEAEAEECCCEEAPAEEEFCCEEQAKGECCCEEAPAEECPCCEEEK